jgi:hypothetical protein
MSFLMLRPERCIVLDRRKRDSNIVMAQTADFLATYFRAAATAYRFRRPPASI